MFTPAEARAIAEFYEDMPLYPPHADDDEAMLAAYLRISMEASVMHRAYALNADALHVDHKHLDASDVTVADKEIERFIRDALSRAFPRDGFHGEESDKKVVDGEETNFVDPIDGTTSFLHFENRSGIALARAKGRDVSLGLVTCPAAGEIGYAFKNNRTRLMQLGFRRSEAQVRKLPVQRNPDAQLCVLLQIGRYTNGIRERLWDAWKQKKMRRMQSILGSPAVSLLEAAKGSSALILQWLGDRETVPYDLAAAMKLVLNAGGTLMQATSSNDGLPKDYRIINQDALLDPIPDRGIVLASGNNKSVSDVIALLQEEKGS